MKRALLFCFVAVAAAGQSAPARGPLRILKSNPRYFTDDSGKVIHLAGTHNWNNFQDTGHRAGRRGERRIFQTPFPGPALYLKACIELTGMPVEIVSVGGTGTYSLSGRYPGVTEIQAGSYLLMDTDYRQCCADFTPALTLLTTVISKTDGERVVTDAGLKALSCERGVPAVKDLPGLRTRRLTAEHAIIDLADASAPVQVGDRIEMWVHYSDATVNLHERIYAMRGGRVEAILRPEG